MATSLTSSQVARLTREEIKAMSAADIKSVLKGFGVIGVTAKKYKGSGTARGLLEELPTKSKEWLSRFSMPRLRAVADLLKIPKRGVLKPVLIDGIYERREVVTVSDVGRDFWLKQDTWRGAIRVYGVRIFSATDLLGQLLMSGGTVTEIVDRESV